MARKLRIAASVFFGLLTVALCVLRVRSFEYADTAAVSFGNNRTYWAMSVDGEFRLGVPYTPSGAPT